MRVAGFVGFALAIGLAQPITAQEMNGPRAQAWPAAASGQVAPPTLPKRFSDAAPTSTLIGAGLLTGAASFIGGAYIGWYLADRYSDCYCEDSGLYGAILGAILLPPIAIPIAVHIANNGAGEGGATMIASLLAGAAAIAAASVIEDPYFAIWAPPLSEMAAAVAVEHALSR